MRGQTFFLPRSLTAGDWWARPAARWTPAQLTGLELWLATHLTQALWQEDLTATPLTRASADGHAIGQIDDQGPHAHRAAAGSAARKPILASGAGRGSYATFDGTNDFLILENSKRALAFVHTTAQFTLLAWVRVASDGANLVLVDSTRGGGTDKAGLLVARNSSGNTLTLFVGKAVAGTPVINKTTTATLRVADGWTPLVVRAGASGGTIQVGDQAPESFSVAPPAASGTPATDDLHIGAVSTSLGAYFNGHLADLVLCREVVSDDEVERFRRYAPSRSAAPLSRALAAGDALLPAQLSHRYQHFDFSDATRLFQQTDKTVAVTADGDPIGAVEHQGGGHLNRDLLAEANDATRPLYRTAAQNGLAAGQWDGADDELGFLNWCKGGALTVFMAAKNNDTDAGSHLLQGAQYIVQTGSNYTGGGDERFVVHPVGEPAPVVGAEAGVGAPVAGEAWHLYEFTRDGAAWTVTVDGVAGADVVNSGVFSMAAIGPQGNPSFWLDGYVGELVKYNVAHSAAHRARLRAGLAAKWGIALAGSA